MFRGAVGRDIDSLSAWGRAFMVELPGNMGVSENKGGYIP